LSSCSFVTNDGVDVICKHCPNLTGKHSEALYCIDIVETC